MKYTTNTNGMLNEVEAFVNEHVANYKRYIKALVETKAVEDFSRNEMAAIRLVSNSSITSMCGDRAKNPKSNLEVLNTPLPVKSVSANVVDETAVKAFMAKLSPEKRKQIFGF